MPFARGLHIEYVSYHYDHGKAWTGSSEPFYAAEIPEEPKTSAEETAEPQKEPPKKKGLFSGLFGKKS